MARSAVQDGVRRRGGTLFGELRRLELMHGTGSLSDDAYRAARERLMRSVADAVEAEKAPAPATAAATGGAGLPVLGAAALVLVAMIGAPPVVLACVGLAALATLGLALAWEA